MPATAETTPDDQRTLRSLRRRPAWRIMRYVFLLLTIAFVVEGVNQSLLWRPGSDISDPDYAHYAAEFESLCVPRQGGCVMPARFSVDLSSLNKGDWQTACVYGGYTDPLEDMIDYGATVSERDRKRMEEAGRGGLGLGRVNEVEESEAAIAYIDGASNAHFILFGSGLGPEQYPRQCISKPETVAYLDSQE